MSDFRPGGKSIALFHYDLSRQIKRAEETLASLQGQLTALQDKCPHAHRTEMAQVALNEKDEVTGIFKRWDQCVDCRRVLSGATS